MKTQVQRRDQLFIYAETLKSIVKWVGVALALVFTWLAVKSVPINSESSAIAWRIALVLYYLSWIAGATTDINIQYRVYVTAPDRGEVTGGTIAAIAALVALGVLLFYSYSQRSYEMAAGTLTLFWIANILGWQYLIKVTRQPFGDARMSYESERDGVGKVRLNYVEEYVTGSWQWRRFVVVGVYVVVYDVIVFTQLGNTLTAWFDVPGKDVIAGFGLLGFVVLAESWMWVRRIRTSVILTLSAELEKDGANT